MINKVKLGLLIKQYREKNKLTKVKLGKLLNVTYQCIIQYEKGERYPSIHRLNLISSVFNIKISSIIKRCEDD
jgi:DNA-binding XRE family transcriptional regulator